MIWITISINYNVPTWLVLDEIYANHAELDDHWKRALIDWKDICTLVEWGGKCNGVKSYKGLLYPFIWQRYVSRAIDLY